MAGANPDRVRAVVGPVVSGLGLDLEQVVVTAAGRRRLLRVVVDGDGGISLDAVADVTRAVSDALDQSDVMGGQPYVLEVSSPGVDRPLTEPRHWHRATSRLVEVTLTDGSEVRGRVMAVDDDSAYLDLSGDRHGEGRVRFVDVARAQVEVEFGRSAGPDAADESPDESTDESGEV
jgi:ribosome maturation factor RimP